MVTIIYLLDECIWLRPCPENWACRYSCNNLQLNQHTLLFSYATCFGQFYHRLISKAMWRDKLIHSTFFSHKLMVINHRIYMCTVLAWKKGGASYVFSLFSWTGILAPCARLQTNQRPTLAWAIFTPTAKIYMPRNSSSCEALGRILQVRFFYYNV